MAFLDRLFGRVTDDGGSIYDDNNGEYELYGQGGVTEEFQPGPEPEDYSPRARQRGARVVDIRQGRPERRQNEIVLLMPNSRDTIWQICDYVRDGKATICNIEGVPVEERQRFVDFIRGAAYALDGAIRPISTLIFVVAPKTTLITVPEAEGEEEIYRAQAVAEADAYQSRSEYRPFQKYAR